MTDLDLYDPDAGEVLVETARDRAISAQTWLLAAADSRDLALTEWQTATVALLRLGGLFSAVRIRRAVVHAAVETDDPELVSGVLANLLDGPVFADQANGNYYVLVPVSTGQRAEWLDRRFEGHAECLGRATFLGVPRTDVTDPEVSFCHWVVPMHGPGDLCSPDNVAVLVTAGRNKLLRETALDVR
ncbi:hypothetical protein AQJ30_15330 [Streptomyces longwoodensis]|uniref:Uncharacterized protein n=1 Tax=Streptomyces longwoodensis TaxID=68231 RepID=A0A101QX16_9ACTN|nr:hypothetical protein [Streptomyces longwoodensis]KUN37657.1 hypothetical protein AQJ30_15330 [Streptomyces longwoodensis]